MRRGPLFYLLMVVLVLRGLMGTAMAAGMLPMQHPAPTGLQASASAMPHELHDHSGHAQAAMPAMDHAQHAGHGTPETTTLACQGGATDGTGCATHSQHANCTACEICHTALMEPPAMPAAPVPLSAGAAHAAATPFDSATAALAIKPPIAS